MLSWRFERALYTALRIANRVPIGVRRITVGGTALHVDSVDRLIAAVSWRATFVPAHVNTSALAEAKARARMS